jgi:hypothetical protein
MAYNNYTIAVIDNKKYIYYSKKDGLYEPVLNACLNYFFVVFFEAGLAGAFLGLAAFRAFSTSSADGTIPKAESFGFRALRTTGIPAATSDHARSSGSVTPARYSAVAAPITLLP